MYKLKLIELYYLLEAKLKGDLVTRQQIKDLMPEISIALKTINQQEKEINLYKLSYQKALIQSNKVKTENDKLKAEINNLKKNIKL